MLSRLIFKDRGRWTFYDYVNTETDSPAVVCDYGEAGVDGFRRNDSRRCNRQQ